jgi:cell division septal protein FtsQ
LFIAIIALGIVVALWQTDNLVGLPLSLPAQLDEGVLIEGVDRDTQESILEQLALTGFIASGDNYIAIINNKIVMPETVLEVDVGRKKFRLKVRKISQNQIVLLAL